ncbi:MAG: hypothetical protein R3228_04885, partial [Halioglobus sp.]|nr:hypothetical protein [Halioglobus sp.]
MSDPGVHPDSGQPYIPVPRATDPAVKVHDLAVIEFAGPDSEKAWRFFRAFGLSGTRDSEGNLMFSAEAGAP